MKAFTLLLCLYMVSLVYGLPIISKPLENNPDHLVWEELLTDPHRSDDKSRKIPKSIFITPNLNESKGNCPPDHKLGPDGRCYKTLQIDPLLMLKKQIESLLKNNSTATTEYDDDYDYSEYGESTESMNSSGQYTVPLSLGFSSENRLQQHRTQHTTFPNLNRIVKDDAHAPSSTTNTDSREKQPFRESTTGVSLGSENITPKLKSIASVATTSSSTTPIAVTDAIETNSEPSANQTVDISQNSSSTETTTAATTVPTINSEDVTDENVSVSSSTNDYNQTLITTQSTQSTSTENTSVSSERIGEDVSSTTDATVSSPLNITIENTKSSENISMQSATVEPSTTEVTVERQSSLADTIMSEISTETIVDRIETQNESSKLQLSELPQVDEAKEKTTHEIDELIPLPQLTEKEEQPSPSYIDEIQNQTETIVGKVDVSQPTVVSMNLKLTSEPVTESAINSPERQTTISEPDSDTSTPAVYLVPKDKHADMLIDAYFIPSDLLPSEEIDPIVDKNSNNGTVQSKYRLENATGVNGTSDAELAPVIDTGKDGHSNIELVKTMTTDESSQTQFDDDKKNLTARLIEELLFEETALELPNRNQVPNIKPAQNFNKQVAPEFISPTQEHIDFVVKSESIENDEDNNDKKVIDVEEALSGASNEDAFNLGSDLTTEQPIDYDSKEFKDRIENIKPESIKIIEDQSELPSKEAIAFKILPIFQLSPPSTSSPRPSIYSTFISHLKVAPSFVEVHDNRPETVQYSHTPVDITSFQNTNRLNGRFTQQDTTHPTYTLPAEYSQENVAQPTPVRAKSLQRATNCYVKNLDQQQYIICDDA